MTKKKGKGNKSSGRRVQQKVHRLSDLLQLVQMKLQSLALLRHDPSGEVPRVTDTIWWDSARGEALGLLGTCKVMAAGIQEDLAWSYDDPQRIEARILLLLDELMATWLGMIRAGDFTPEEMETINDFDRRLEWVVNRTRSAVMPKEFVLHCGPNPRVHLDGQLIPLTETEDRILKRLANAAGTFVGAEGLKEYEGSGEDPGKVIRNMSPPLKKLISSQTGPQGGYRLLRQPRVVEDRK